MTKRDWIYGGLIAILFVSLGIAVGIHLRKSKEWKIELRASAARIVELDAQMKAVEVESVGLMTIADEANTSRAEIKQTLVETEAEVAKWRKRAANKAKPITITEYVVYTGQLEGSIVLLNESLTIADQEIFTLRDVITTKNAYIDLVESKLVVIQDMNKIYRRASKKDKRIKIWSNILSGSLGMVVGVAVGKVSN